MYLHKGKSWLNRIGQDRIGQMGCHSHIRPKDHPRRQDSSDEWCSWFWRVWFVMIWWMDKLNGAFGRVFSPSPSSIWKISKLAGSVYDITYIYIYFIYNIYIYILYYIIYIYDTYIFTYMIYIYIYIYYTYIYIYIYHIYIYTYICVCDWQLIFKYWGRHKRWVSNIEPWKTANITQPRCFHLLSIASNVEN